MAENYEIRVGVDASDAEKGLKALDSATTRSRSNLAAFEKTAKAAFNSLDASARKVKLGSMASDTRAAAAQIKALSSAFSNASRQIDQFSSRATRSITALSRSISGVNFGRMTSDIAKIGSAFNTMSGQITRATTQMRSLSTQVGNVRKALSSFPSSASTAFSKIATSATKLTASMRALNGIKISPNVIQAISALSGASLGGFRGPSAAAVRNLQALLAAMNTANPAKITQVATALQRLNNLNIRVSGSGLSNLGKVNTGNFSKLTAQVNSLTGSLRSVHYMIGAVQTALSLLTLGGFFQSVLASGNALNTFHRSLGAVATSAEEYASHIKFVDDLTKQLPVGLEETQRSFGKFAVSARLAGVSAEDTQKTFKAFATAFSVLGVSAENQEGAFLALEQMFAKGTIQAEELRRQLGNYLPGAFELMAKAIGKTPNELSKLMQQGKVSAREMLKLADLVSQIYSGQLPAALLTSRAAIVQVENDWVRFKQTIFSSGFDTGMAAMFRSIHDGLQNIGIEDVARQVGAALEDVFVTVGAVAQTAIEHWEDIKKVGEALLVIAGARAAVAVLQAMMSPLVLIGAGLAISNPLLIAFGGAMLVLRSGLLPAAAAMATFAASVVAATWEFLAAAAAGIALAEAILYVGRSLNITDVQSPMKSFVANIKGGLQEIMGTITNGDLQNSLAAGFNTDAIFGDFQKNMEKAIADAEKIKGTTPPTQFNENRKREEETAALHDKEIEALTKQQQQLYDKLDPIQKANRLYQDQIKLIETLQQKGMIDGAEAKRLRSRLDRTTLDERDPYGAATKKLRDEIEINSQVGDQREVEMELLRQRNALLDKGVEMTGQQEAALRQLIATNQELADGGTNGFQRWANGVKSFKENLMDVEQGALNDLADQIAEVTTGGEADFVALGRSILKNIASASIKALMKDAFSGWNGPSLSGAAGAASNGTTSVKDIIGSALGMGGSGSAAGALSSTASMVVNAGTVIVNGGVLGAAGAGGAASVVSSLSGAVSSGGSSPVTGAVAAAAAVGAAAGTKKVWSDWAGNSAAVTPVERVNLPVTPGAVASPFYNALNGPGLGATAPVSMADRLKTLSDLSVIRPDSSITPSDALGSIITPAGKVVQGLPINVGDSWAGPGALSMGGSSSAVAQAVSGGTGKFAEVGNFVARGAGNVDAKLKDILRTAAERGGYNVQAFSGYRPGDIRFHGKGLATDVRLLDKNGNFIGGAKGNYQDAASFRAYEQFAQDAKRIQMEKYPELAEKFRWGGYFSGGKGKYGAGDGMHFDLGGSKNLGMAGGSWAGGLNARQRAYFPGANSQGMGADWASQRLGAPQAAQQFEQSMQPATAQVAQNFQSSMTGATQQASSSFVSAMQPGVQQVSQSFSGQMTTATSQLGSTLTSSVGNVGGNFASAGSSIAAAGAQAAQATGGFGSLTSSLTSMLSSLGGMGGGGGFGGLISGVGSLVTGGLYKEGGFAGSPVSSFAAFSGFRNAPHFAEGTGLARRAGGMSSMGGGFPAVLHDNEAVIPLTRGREVPVSLTKDDRNPNNGGGVPTIAVHLHGVKDYNSFKRSSTQMRAQVATLTQIAAKKNN